MRLHHHRVTAQLTGDLYSIVFIEQHVFCWLLSHQGQLEEAEHYIADALKTAKRIGDPSWECSVLTHYARILRLRHMFDQALASCRQAQELVPLAVESQQIYLRAYIEYELGKSYRDRGDWQGAQSHLYAARDVFRDDEADPAFNVELAWGILSNLGFIEHQLGNLDTAEQMYLQCLSFVRELGGKGTMTTLLTRLAQLEEQRGNRTMALAYANEALHWTRRLGMIEEQTLLEELRNHPSLLEPGDEVKKEQLDVNS